MPANRDLGALYPAFRQKVLLVLADLEAYAKVHMIGYEWRIVEGFRTASYQRSLYAQGRTRKGPIVTMRDGYKRKSNHQSSLAVDIVPFHGHDFDWDGKSEWWDYLAHCARKHGLKAGRDWTSFRDNPHIEWPEDDHETYRLASLWQKENGLA